MTSRIQLASLLVALLTLAACGGGGSGTSSTDAAAAPVSTESEAAPTPTAEESAPDGAAKSMADAFEGDWEGCYQFNGIPVTSSFEQLQITRISDTEFAYLAKVTDTYGTDCAGEVVSSHEGGGRITLTGPVSVWDPVTKRGVHAERYEGISADNRLFKLLFSITEGDLLRFGNGEDRGPDGYPRSLKETSYGRK